MKRLQHFLTVVVVGLAVLLTSGCASTKPLPVGLRTETQSGDGVKITSVNLLHDDSGLLVSGRVKQIPGYYGSPFRHLDVEIQDSEGNVLAQEATKFFPNPIPRSRFGPRGATYTARFSDLPPDGNRILVTVHATALSKCRLTKYP